MSQKMIKKAVKEVERAQRVNRMQKNPALEMHRDIKGTSGRKQFTTRQEEGRYYLRRG